MNVEIVTCGRAIPFLGIFVSNFRYRFFAVPTRIFGSGYSIFSDNTVKSRQKCIYRRQITTEGTVFFCYKYVHRLMHIQTKNRKFLEISYSIFTLGLNFNYSLGSLITINLLVGFGYVHLFADHCN
jgi:hypothetical protein